MLRGLILIYGDMAKYKLTKTEKAKVISIFIESNVLMNGMAH